MSIPRITFIAIVVVLLGAGCGKIGKAPEGAVQKETEAEKAYQQEQKDYASYAKECHNLSYIYCLREGEIQWRKEPNRVYLYPHGDAYVCNGKTWQMATCKSELDCQQGDGCVDNVCTEGASTMPTGNFLH